MILQDAESSAACKAGIARFDVPERSRVVHATHPGHLRLTIHIAGERVLCLVYPIWNEEPLPDESWRGSVEIHRRAVAMRYQGMDDLPCFLGFRTHLEVPAGGALFAVLERAFARMLRLRFSDEDAYRIGVDMDAVARHSCQLNVLVMEHDNASTYPEYDTRRIQR